MITSLTPFTIGWWNLKRHSLWKKSTAAGLAVIFTYSSVGAPLAEANFWAERRENGAARETQRSQGENRRQLLNDSASAGTAPLTGLSVPDGAGAVTEAYWPPVAGVADGAAPLVIHLQDAHGHEAA